MPASRHSSVMSSSRAFDQTSCMYLRHEARKGKGVEPETPRSRRSEVGCGLRVLLRSGASSRGGRPRRSDYGSHPAGAAAALWRWERRIAGGAERLAHRGTKRRRRGAVPGRRGPSTGVDRRDARVTGLAGAGGNGAHHALRRRDHRGPGTLGRAGRIRDRTDPRAVQRGDERVPGGFG